LDDATSPTPELQRLHPATIILEIVSLARGWAVPIGLILVVSGAPDGVPWWLWFGLIAASLQLLASIARYFTLRYGVISGHLIIRSGILFRQNRTIPLDRIQNVHLKSGLLHRLFRVAEVRVETAGSEAAEASLSVLGREHAAQVRQRLLERSPKALPPGADNAPEEATSAGDEGQVIRRLRLGDLLLAGATENRIGVLFLAMIGLLEILGDVGIDEEAMIDEVGRAIPGLSSGVEDVIAVGLGIAAAVGLFVLGWVASILWTVVTYFRFTLGRAGDDLTKSHGLLTRFESVIPVPRIQVLRVEASWPRRKLGVLGVKVSTAGSAGDEHQGGTSFLCPILPATEAAGFCEGILPGSRIDALDLSGVPLRARRRSFVRLVAPAMIAVGVIALGGAPAFAWGLALWVPLAWFLAWARHRALGYGLAGRYLLARAGVWTRKLWIVPREKIQGVAVRQSPLQRWLGLATLSLSTAGSGSVGHVRVVDMSADAAHALFETLAREAARGSRAGL
jgi:putative membrane protein